MPERVMCPECQDRLERSTVYEGMCLSTLVGIVPYFDEEGRRHVHDPNRTTCDYQCSRGHHFTLQEWHSCWCGWTQKANG